MLVGTFTRRQPDRRDLLLIALADNPAVQLKDLAWAFRISGERLRQVRRFVEEHGPEALLERPGKGRKPLSERMKKRIEALLDAGLNIDQAHAKVKHLTSRSSVGRVHKQWAARNKKQGATVASEPSRARPAAEATEDVVVVAKEARPARRCRSTGAIEPVAGRPRRATELSVQDAAALGGTHVQHLGTWLMLGELHQSGLYESAERLRGDAVNSVQLRVALDATAVALTLGQRCVEGVRRLATPSAATLLRHRCAPSPSWTRERLQAFADEGAVPLHLVQASRHARKLASEQPERLVFYVDNHLRPYTGEQVIRKGWRMQDKRAVPGCTDYYVHDAIGRPVMRMDIPAHDSLVAVVPAMGQFLRRQVGDEVPLLLVFDRAGAYPEHMAELRDGDLEFVTYEKKPYPTLPTTAFGNTLDYRGETLRWTESRLRNLGHGRGRVRRIALLTADGAQVNVVAVSGAPAPELVQALLHRWGFQENQLKHEKERWGINQLDGRRVQPYPEGAVIPNPARRRLDRDLRHARNAEAEALRELAHLPQGHPRRDELEETAQQSYDRQCEITAQRTHVPTRAALRDTELAGRLRFHDRRYKLVVDTVRIALANAETDLARTLAEHLSKPREAKKTLANLFAAPGTIRFGKSHIRVNLNPAGTPRERLALQTLLDSVNTRRLTLPGDPSACPLLFTIPNS